MLVLTRRVGETLMIDDTAVTVAGINGSRAIVKIERPDGTSTQQRVSLDDHPTIGETTITLCGIKGRQVKLGIVAPKDVVIHRLEIYQRMQKEQARAA